MNVLITSAAAKVLLVQAFQVAAAARGGLVFTADVAAQCAAGFFSHEHIQVCRTDAPGAFDGLVALCERRKIQLIVPTRDAELVFYATWKTAFAEHGITVLAPDQERLATCLDKRRFSAAIERVGLSPIPTLSAAEASASFPVFVRPIVGAGGRGAMRINTAQEFSLLQELDHYLVHPFVAAPEYSIDLLMDLDGTPLQAVARVRNEVSAGESKKSTIVSHPELEAQTMQLGAALGLVGHNTVQAFDDPVRGILFIEVNPRFGGASNCSIAAGLSSPARLLGLLSGDSSARAPRPIRHGLVMYRYSQDVFDEPSS